MQQTFEGETSRTDCISEAFPFGSRGLYRMTTANKITIARILLIPLFVMMAIYYGSSVERGAPAAWQRWCAIAIFVIAAASDGIDGYIARRYNQRSRLGVTLDPIADKGLLLAGIITLSITKWAYKFPLWFPVLVITRDSIIVAGAMVLHLLNGSVQVRPTWAGKCATAFQMIALALVMLQMDLFKKTISFFGLTFEVHFLDLPVWLAGLFTAISGVGYIVDGIGQLNVHGQAENTNGDSGRRD
jgi:cardiolipin synthase